MISQLLIKSQIVSVLLCLAFLQMTAQSVAQQWNEVLLTAIRSDQARPTVHARNLFHISAAGYDAWAAYEPSASTFFLGNIIRGFSFPYESQEEMQNEVDKRMAQEMTFHYATFRLILHRFKYSPGIDIVKARAELLMKLKRYDIDFTSQDYKYDGPAALGNYLAAKVIEFGLGDGSNERNNHESRAYEPINDPMSPDEGMFRDLRDPNRWQPLSFTQTGFIGQSGVESETAVPAFIGAEWGKVVPFALPEEKLTRLNREGQEYWVYHDPGSPSLLSAGQTSISEYQNGFAQVAHWSAQMNPSDSVKWDISPASIGNLSMENLIEGIDDESLLYDFEGGGDQSTGYEFNPKTSLAYVPQIINRGDYSRVLAEFWADGPDSETPPGHWFTILNYVNRHSEFSRPLNDEGQTMDPFEWNVKSYFTLGGAMHDAAVAAWGIKGYYDYVRPISAIRAMALRGQCSDPDLANYHPMGIPLKQGLIEQLEEGDPLLRGNGSIGDVKIKSWRDVTEIYVDSTQRWETSPSQVDWVLGESWVPYQRPTFVTPPFAGYVSGHSTFSRAAARVLSTLTGDEYFPGGMGEFVAAKNRFLVFEQGPSEDVILQWPSIMMPPINAVFQGFGVVFIRL